LCSAARTTQGAKKSYYISRLLVAQFIMRARLAPSYIYVMTGVGFGEKGCKIKAKRRRVEVLSYAQVNIKRTTLIINHYKYF